MIVGLALAPLLIEHGFAYSIEYQGDDWPRDRAYPHADDYCEFRGYAFGSYTFAFEEKDEVSLPYSLIKCFKENRDGELEFGEYFVVEPRNPGADERTQSEIVGSIENPQSVTETG